jgi:hypothetical protein
MRRAERTCSSVLYLRPNRSLRVGQPLVAECRRLRSFLAVGDAAREKSALGRVTRQVQRRAEMASRDLVSPALKLELTECRLVERIRAKAIDASDLPHSLECALRPLDLRERHRSVQRHHGRRPNPRQNSVQRDDLAPGGVPDAARASVHPGDRGLDVVVGELIPRRR